MNLKLFKKIVSNRDFISHIVAILEIILYVVLSLTYPHIAEKYGYMGFVYNFNLLRFLSSTLLVCFLIVIGIFIKNDFIYAVWHIYLVYNILPFTIGFYTSLNGFQVVVVHLIFMIVLILFSYIKFPNINFYNFNINNKNNFIILLVLAIILSLPFLYYLPYINFKNLLMKNIYETRFLFREISVKPLNYISTGLVRIILPVIFISSIIKKKYIISFISLIFIIYIFLCGAFRSYFVGLLAMIVFFVGSNRFKPVIFTAAVLFMSIFGYLFNDLYILVDAGIRRVLFVPVHLEQIYYEIFNNNPLYWSQYSFCSVFKEYPFDRPLTYYVGEVILNRPAMNANVGMLMEGFISAGYIGVTIYSLILALFFIFIESLKINSKYFGLIIIIIFITTNSFLFTSILTHGILVFILIAFFFLKNTSYMVK